MSELISCQTRETKTIKVGHREHPIERVPAVMPPAFTVSRDLPRQPSRCPQFQAFPVGCLAALPVFELDRAQSVTHPPVKLAPDARCLR